MTNSELKDRLIGLLPKNGFQSQGEAIEWTTKVAPLLKKRKGSNLDK